MKRRYWWLIVIGMLLVLVIIGGILYAANFARSVTTTQTHTAPGPATDCGTSVPSSGLSTYQIVPDQTTASYSVHENLVIQNLPDNVAVGKTHSVQGSFRIRTGANPLVANMNITVDLRTLQSDSERRDHYIQQNSLQTDTYPTATFVSTCAQNLPANYNDGQTVRFQLVGNLTMHGKTNREVFDVQGKVSGQTITGTATSTIFMTDFGIEPPNLANIAISQNKTLITLDFTARKA